MAQALYRKWRSRTFDEVVGQEHVTRTLQNALSDGHVAHAYLFSGPRGDGEDQYRRASWPRRSTAPDPRRIRPCDGCPTCAAINEGRMIDLVEIDAASNNSVDDIRELRDKGRLSPQRGRLQDLHHR